MAGLQDITDKIISDAKAVRDEKIAAAEECVKNIRTEYAEEIARVRAKNAEVLKEIGETAKENAEFALRAKEREAILSVENSTVAEIIAEAKGRLLKLPTNEYFALLTDIYRNNAENGEGELLLTKADRERMPEDFLKTLSGIKGKLTLSDEDAPSAGFVVRYGRVELNCTFDAIFEDKYNLFSDIASQCCKE